LILTPEEMAYYSRQLVLADIGPSGQARLKKAKVLVAGVGGLGCQSSAQLTSMGVGFLRLVDKDVVETSNLQRQHLYDFGVVGYPKAEAAALRLRRMNPYVEVEPLPMAINPWTAGGLLDGIDLVLDGLDRLTPRLALNRACVERGIPYIFGAAITHVGNTTTVVPGESPCLECWQGSIDESAIPTCATVGVTPSVISVVASIQVSEAVRILLGKKPLLSGKLFYVDMAELDFQSVSLAKVPSCHACGSGQTEPPPFEPVSEVCGRDGRRVFTISPKEPARLQMATLSSRVKAAGLNVDLASGLGVTASRDGLRVSFFSTGCAVVEGAESRDEAVSLYARVVRIPLG